MEYNRCGREQDIIPSTGEDSDDEDDLPWAWLAYVELWDKEL